MTQGQNPIDSALFGALMGDFSDVSTSLPTQGVIESGIDASSSLLMPAITLSQSTAQSAIQSTTPDDTLSLLSSSIQTAEGLSVAGQGLLTQSVPTQMQSSKQQAITPRGDMPKTEFQRLSGQVVEDEGDVVISPLTGQPFFNSLADTQTVNQTMAHQTSSSPVAVDVGHEALSNAVSLGDEQGAPVFASYTSTVSAKDAMSAASYSAASNNAMSMPTGATAATQQSAMMQQHNQSQQQQSDARADGALRAIESAKSDVSTNQTDVEAFASVLTSFSPTSPLAIPLTSPLSLRQPQWTQDMGNRMQMMVSQRMKEVEVKLDPVELGPVRIHLKMDEENKAHVTLSAQHGLTRDMLENALPRLRDMLAQQGVDIGTATVDSGAGQQASDQQQQSSGQNKTADLSNDAANPVSDTSVWKNLDGLVDHFV
jgi:flagellar hook-length control protein FliK